jgi:uncharacterized membrane protein YphA (DoxX/SURF4 family)
MSQAFAPAARPIEDLAAWKRYTGLVCAVLLAALFLLSGLWKATDPIGVGVRMAQFQVPAFLSEFSAIAFGIAETFAAILLLTPRYRKIGAVAIALMLVAFIAWGAFYYDVLTGKECSCFPWIKRAMGPGFFISDGVMLLMAIGAALWSRPLDLSLKALRPAALLLAGLTVLTMGSYAYGLSRQSGAQAPASIALASGKQHDLRSGKQLLYFYDPQCMHCFHAAQAMSKLNFGDTQVIAIPTTQKQFAQTFLDDTGFKVGKVTNEGERLKQVFPFGDPPYAVLLENGRQKAAITNFDAPMPNSKLIEMEFAK